MARPHILKFRVDDAELQTVETAAKACGQSVSDFLRGIVLGQAGTPQAPTEAINPQEAPAKPKGKANARCNGCKRLWPDPSPTTRKDCPQCAYLRNPGKVERAESTQG